MIRTEFLILEAKSFYDAFVTLEQHYQSSEGEYKVVKYAPLMVNGAFSIELSMKAILAKNKIDYRKEHNLVVLFRLLPKAFQFELLGNLDEKAPEYKDTEQFCDELLLISNAFVDWRYAFEGKPAPAINTWFVSAFANAAYKTMVAHYDVDVVRNTTNRESEEEIAEKFLQNREECKSTNLAAIQKKIKE